METVEKPVVANESLETTTVKDVYTAVYMSVDNSRVCGLNISIPQPKASNSRLILIIHSYPQVYQQVDTDLFLAWNLNSVNDFTDLVVKLSAVLHLIGDLVVAVKHSGVVAVSKDLTDFR